MKININDIAGNIVKHDERYIVVDNTTLKDLIVSSTTLRPGKSTSGHFHRGQEEVYFFIKGCGEIQLDNEKISVTPGDVILIPDGAFHRVFNTSDTDLYFVCVFNGKRAQ